jgi:hypothetical protein
MIYDFFRKKLLPAGALSALIYFFFDPRVGGRNLFFGALVLLAYFLFVSAKTQGMLVSYFGFTKSLRIRLLAIFLSVVTLGWFLGFFIFFNYFNSLAVFLSFFANILIWSLVKVKKEDANSPEEFDEKIVDEPPHEKISALFYFGLVIYGFYLLMQSETNGVISSPWQTIDTRYVWVFLLATFLLGMLILFSKISIKTLLFFVIAHSFLLHSYLPLTHDLFYGADGWRHIGNEQRLMDGKGFKEAELVGLSNSESKVQSLKSKVGQLSYANFWGTNVVRTKILGIDLIFLTKWLLPISWSLIFTILLYEIGLTLGWSGRKSLLLAWGGMWPFALQAAGSFSLPVNFGFLIFVLFFLLLLKRAREPNVEQKNILIALGAGSALGYLLFFVLYWLCWGIMAALKSGKKLIIIPSLILAPLALPALELVAKFSVWDGQVNILTQAKQFAGNLLAIYLANGPRPHEISGGNILFNQIPASIFTPNFLTEWLWWLPILVLGAFVFIILGIKQNWQHLVYKLILFSFIILLTSYFLSFYLLAGEHLFSRRIDAILAFLFLILLFYGLKDFLSNKNFSILCVALLSLAITASYTLGPDTMTVSSNQLEAAKYIWSYEQNNNTPCVLGDTYPLLALEAVSQKEIIGGGFPIDANFSQPERVEFYKQMNIAINDNLLHATADLTKSDHCWFVGETANFARQGILGGNSAKIFGDVAVVRYNTPLPPLP